MKYRIYADGTVIHEDDFTMVDYANPYHDDHQEVEVPDVIVEYIENTALGK